MDLGSLLCGSLDGRGVWGRIDMCIRMAVFLCSPPETSTLLISYTPIQNKKFFEKCVKNRNIHNSIYMFKKHIQHNTTSRTFQ